MTKREYKRKLMLEHYIAFFQDPDLPSLTMDQLNEMVSMHGFIRPRTKNETIEGLKSVDLADPGRSTVGRGGGGSSAIYPCATLELEEVRADMKSLCWEECPIGSILAVRSSSSSSTKEEPRTEKKRRKDKAAAAATPLPISCSPAMTIIAAPGSQEKKRRRKKKKRSKSMAMVTSKAVVVV